MRHLLLSAVAMALLLFGCTQNPTFLPGFEFGQSEAEWKETKSKMVSKGTLEPRIVKYDTMHEFTWKLEGADIKVYASLNNDAFHEGPLRMVSFDLTTDLIDLDKTLLGSISKYPGENIARFCYESKVDKVKLILTEKYGKPTSVKVASTGDTVFRYERPEFDLDLLKGNPIPDTTTLNMGQAIDYKYRTAQVNIFAKNYERQREDLISSKQSQLRPENVVRLHFPEPKLTRSLNPNGNTYPALQIYADYVLGASPYERRTIERIKGELQVTDRFGDIVFKQTGMEYAPSSPIQPMTFYNANSGWTMYLANNQPETKELREAIRMQKQLEVVFKPTAVYYIDGSVLK